MTVSRERIDEYLDSLPDAKRWKSRKEWNYVSELLAPDEGIRAVTTGVVDKSTWLVIVTSQRLLLIERRFMLGMREREIMRDSIQSVVTRSWHALW